MTGLEKKKKDEEVETEDEKEKLNDNERDGKRKFLEDDSDDEFSEEEAPEVEIKEGK